MPAQISEILRTIGYGAPKQRVGEIPPRVLAALITNSAKFKATYPQEEWPRILDELMMMPVKDQLLFLKGIGADMNHVDDIIAIGQDYSRPSGGSGFMPGDFGPNPRGY